MDIITKLTKAQSRPSSITLRQNLEHTYSVIDNTHTIFLFIQKNKKCINKSTRT